MKIIKDNNILNGVEVKALVEKFGALASFEGSMYEQIDADQIEDDDQFAVVINYGHGIQLHLQAEGERAHLVIDGIKGKCGELVENDVLQVAQWYAEI